MHTLVDTALLPCRTSCLKIWVVISVSSCQNFYTVCTTIFNEAKNKYLNSPSTLFFTFQCDFDILWNLTPIHLFLEYLSILREKISKILPFWNKQSSTAKKSYRKNRYINSSLTSFFTLQYDFEIPLILKSAKFGSKNPVLKK